MRYKNPKDLLPENVSGPLRSAYDLTHTPPAPSRFDAMLTQIRQKYSDQSNDRQQFGGQTSQLGQN